VGRCGEKVNGPSVKRKYSKDKQNPRGLQSDKRISIAPDKKKKKKRKKKLKKKKGK